VGTADVHQRLRMTSFNAAFARIAGRFKRGGAAPGCP
jgi:hypothetical protein